MIPEQVFNNANENGGHKLRQPKVSILESEIFVRNPYYLKRIDWPRQGKRGISPYVCGQLSKSEPAPLGTIDSTIICTPLWRD